MREDNDDKEAEESVQLNLRILETTKYTQNLTIAELRRHDSPDMLPESVEYMIRCDLCDLMMFVVTETNATMSSDEARDMILYLLAKMQTGEIPETLEGIWLLYEHNKNRIIDWNAIRNYLYHIHHESAATAMDDFIRDIKFVNVSSQRIRFNIKRAETLGLPEEELKQELLNEYAYAIISAENGRVELPDDLRDILEQQRFYSVIQLIDGWIE